MPAPVDPPSLTADPLASAHVDPSEATTAPSQFDPAEWLPQIGDGYGDLVGDLIAFFLVALVVYLVARLAVVPALVRVVRARNRNNPTIVTAVETYLAVLAFIVAGLAGVAAAGRLGTFVGTDSAIVVAALTFALGVAGQEVFGSLISGIFLVADQDFNVGDWVSWPGGEGVVEAVDFRVTRVRTRNNETVTVPNTELTTNALTRPYGRRRFRVVEEAEVAYDEDTERALLELQQVAAGVDGVLADPSPTARVEELGGDSVVVSAAFWVADPDRRTVDRVRSAFRRAVKLRFAEAGLTLSPPADRSLSGSLTVDGPVGEEAPSDD